MAHDLCVDCVDLDAAHADDVLAHVLLYTPYPYLVAPSHALATNVPSLSVLNALSLVTAAVAAAVVVAAH